MQGITKQSGSEASLPIIVAAQLYFVDLADFNQLSAHPAFTCYESKTWRALFSARRKKNSLIRLLWMPGWAGLCSSTSIPHLEDVGPGSSQGQVWGTCRGWN